MRKNLVLTGMMGSGKSTIGRELSKKLTLKFFDIDKLIEKREKCQFEKSLLLREKSILEGSSKELA